MSCRSFRAAGVFPGLVAVRSLPRSIPVATGRFSLLVRWPCRGTSGSLRAVRGFCCSHVLRSGPLLPSEKALLSSSSSSSSKVFASADEAVADIKSGATILSSGFGLCGVPETLIAALRRRGPEAVNGLTCVSNNVGVEGRGGLALLAEVGMVDRLVCSHLGNNRGLQKKYLTGALAVELCPQGTLAERLRAAGSGIPAFFTATGAHTLVQDGGIPVRLGADGRSVVEPGRRREVRVFGDGRTYLLEPALPGDVALLRAAVVDTDGNCVLRRATKSFGHAMAQAARVAIVEAEQIVAPGTIEPDNVDIPGLFIDRIVPATAEKLVEVRTTRDDKASSTPSESSESSTSPRHRIARRAAKELRPGSCVNLGIGIPTLAPSYLPPATAGTAPVWIQSENGILGMGPYPTEAELDPDLINAGKETVTLVPGAAVFNSIDSFAMIRGGHIDVSILGALQVAANGDLANYLIPGKVFKGMGGAMDLVSNPDRTKIVVATEHVAKDGSPKVVQHCNLPLTGAQVVSTIITELCVFQVNRAAGTLTLTEIAPGVTVDEIKAKTDAAFTVADGLEQME